MNTGSRTYTVSEFNAHVKGRLESDRELLDVFVTGEISNYKLHFSGHHYFSIKDEKSSLRCVMYKGKAYSLRFRPENGMKVILHGSVSVYERNGEYQLNCDAIVPAGAGELQIAFEQLKNKLDEEGLFDSRYKKPLPAFPDRIAVITSATGAAVHDIINILRKRWPLVGVLVVPVLVQGQDAPADIRTAIDYVNEHSLADLIITGRGGGSMEDLWAFNTEEVCRAIFRSEIPVISAVGHEPDVTISDFVADMRASTPSNAAERAVPEINEMRDRISAYRFKITSKTEKRISESRREIDLLRKNRLFVDPAAIYQDYRMDLDNLFDELQSLVEDRLKTARNDIGRAEGRLKALNPLGVLSRGYAVASKDGYAVSSSAQLSINDRISLLFADGSAECTVNSVSSRE